MEYTAEQGTWFPTKTYHRIKSKNIRFQYAKDHSNVMVTLKNDYNKELMEFIDKQEMIEICEKLLEVLKG